MRATPASIQYSGFSIQNVDFLVFLLTLRVYKLLKPTQ